MIKRLVKFLINKVVNLYEEVKDDNGSVKYRIDTMLSGNGETPVLRTIGLEKPIGYTDNGEAIISEVDEEDLKKRQKNFMAEAIKEQKNLCVENGVDPSLVNYFGAEKESVENNG